MHTKPKLPLFDRALGTAAWIALASLWAITLYHYNSLPGTIPTHYDLSGKPDRYGKKAMLLLLPLIGTVLFAILGLLNRYPRFFNYPGKLTEANAARLLRILRLGILLTFLTITWGTIIAATGQAEGPGWWPLAALVCFIVLPAACFTIRAMQLSK